MNFMRAIWERTGRVEGMLRKINDLHNTSKLVAAGLISVNESSDSRRDVC